MTDVPGYTTLRDYLHVLRRNRLIILVAMILFGAGAWLLTAGDKNTYQAQATLSFQDVFLQTGDLNGVSVVPTGTALQRVEIDAATITRPAIVNRVAVLIPNVPRGQLTSGVSGAVENTTGFLVIQARSTSPPRAAQLAQAYAEAVQAEEQQLARNEFATAARTLQTIAQRPAIRSNPASSTLYQQRISDLEFDAQTATPVSIATNAAVPSTPISPHPVRDTVLGVILGLLLGIIIGFARDALDRRLRGSREITQELEWPIMGHVQERTLGRARFVGANGERRPEEAELEPFRILRQNIQFLNLDQPPRSILVTSATPEEGKSTVAALLAYASALTGKLTLLVDCDLRRSSLAEKLGVGPEPGLTDYLLDEAQPAEILRTIPLGLEPSSNGRTGSDESSELVPPHVRGSRLVFIPAGKPTPFATELLSSKRVSTFLAEVSARYDLVVIDASPVLPVADALQLLPEVDGTLLCVRGSRTSANELRAVKAAIDRLPERPIGVVITGVPRGSETDFGYYSYQYR